MEGPQYKQLSGPSRARYTNVRWLLRPPRDLAISPKRLLEAIIAYHCHLLR